MKRVFISIELPENIKKEIQKIQEKLPEFHGKKTEFENLHLTLKFLGEIDDEKIEEVRKRLNKVEFKKLECGIDEIGVFNEKFIKIVWIHLNGCEELQKKIDEFLFGLFGKEKRFMSHITIARIKSVKDKKKFLGELKKIKLKEIKFVVDKFRLMESVLMPEGPKYKTIEEYNLK